MLANLLFSEYRRRVLGLLLLHPDEQYHLREIARLTATQPGTLGRELKKLVQAGILKEVAVGNQRIYSADLDCPVHAELASILRKTSGLVDVLSEALLPLAGNIDHAFVFGSVAGGKATNNSDIDLLLVGELDYTEVIRRLYPVQSQLGREINPKLYTPAEWQRLSSEQGAFIKDVLNKPRLNILGSDIANAK